MGHRNTKLKKETLKTLVEETYYPDDASRKKGDSDVRLLNPVGNAEKEDSDVLDPSEQDAFDPSTPHRVPNEIPAQEGAHSINLAQTEASRSNVTSESGHVNQSEQTIQPSQENRPIPSIVVTEPANYQRPFIEGEFEFLKYLSYDELSERLARLDAELHREIKDLNAKYSAQLQALYEAFEAKRLADNSF